MGPSNIRDLLTTFSPSLDFFAISSGDGRIKIWDTLKGQVQTEFADIISTDTTNLYSKPERGHLSVDYTCLKWLSLDSKKKRKLRCSLLVLGTGSGDVLALDVSAGELKWRIGDCHPGLVSGVVGLNERGRGLDCWSPRFSRPFNDWEVEEVGKLLVTIQRSALDSRSAIQFSKNIIWSPCVPTKVVFFAWEASWEIPFLVDMVSTWARSVVRGVSAISCSTDGSCIYAAGADGMISKIDSSAGNLLGKFRASTKAISSMSVSSDGKVLATAAAQLKILNSSDHKKIQKFSGHPGAVRCMIFTDDGEYILSSAIGERYIAVWRIDGSKKQSASCVLAMEHPAVFLDSRCIDNGDTDKSGLYVLAISEIGVCYFWYAKNMEDLRNTKPTKVSVSLEDNFSKNHKGSLPTIFAAKLQGVVKPASGDVFVAYGSLVKPSFQKVIVHSGTDIKINISQDGILLPMDQSHKSKKGLGVKDGGKA
ncbi:hypothetical protein CK203_018993 [Vitis vinifera]|uniref:Uncharacterized protein n=1 Tax=Vitis vinifera TaxID=29760 RepID=A0A438IR65_VITVI|nr:hypothetical protein CK203_018993 [Vitis vinifera]